MTGVGEGAGGEEGDTKGTQISEMLASDDHSTTNHVRSPQVDC